MPGKHAKNTDTPNEETIAVFPESEDQATEDAVEATESSDSTVDSAVDEADATDASDVEDAADGGAKAAPAHGAPAAQLAPPGTSQAMATVKAAEEGAEASSSAAETPSVGAHAAPSLPAGAPPVAPPGVSSNEAISGTAGNLSVIDAESGAFISSLEPKKRHTARNILITLGVIVVLLAAVYGAGAYVFSQRFLPNTSFGDIDVSLHTAEEVEAEIDDIVNGYQLDVVGGAFSYRATAKDLGLSMDTAKMAQEMLESQDQWRWPLLLLEGHQEVESVYTVEYDADALSASLEEKVNAYNESATPPENATVVYDDASDAFVVQPEVAGTQYQPEAVVAVADAAVKQLEPFVSLQPDQLVQPTIKSDDEKLKTAAEEATTMVSAHLKLTLDGQDAGEIGPDDLYELVWFDDELNASLDEDALNVWIDGIVKRFDTVGTERYYTRPDGKEITVSGGAYGWEVDQDALRQAVLDCVYSGSDVEMDVPCYSTAQVFNGIGNPDWGNRYVDVDLSEQYVRFYDENSEIIWESACISGTPDGEHDTVVGVWKINNKESPSKLIGYNKYGKKEYETTVTYWMAFEENAIGFHDATWQPDFGGEMYRQGYGSHGCVNLPYDKAAELYNIIDWDDVVIVHW